MSPHLRVINDFILIISSILQSINFIFPRVSANVIIEETFFLEAKLKRYGVLGMLKPTSRTHALQNMLYLLKTKDFPLQNYKTIKDSKCHTRKQ